MGQAATLMSGDDHGGIPADPSTNTALRCRGRVLADLRASAEAMKAAFSSLPPVSHTLAHAIVLQLPWLVVCEDRLKGVSVSCGPGQDKREEAMQLVEMNEDEAFIDKIESSLNSDNKQLQVRARMSGYTDGGPKSLPHNRPHHKHGF
jgi:hypothetical protein